MSILGAGLDTFWVTEDQMPSDMAVFLATRVAGGEDEWSSPHTFAVRLVRPDLEEEAVLQATLEMPNLPPLKQPGHEAGMLLPLVMQWRAQDYGLHSFDLFLDGTRERSAPINVRPQTDLAGDTPPSPEET